MKEKNIQDDPAFPAMTMDILNNVLTRADSSAKAGDYLAEEIRELTGARCVAMIQYRETGEGWKNLLVSVNPLRRRPWSQSPEAEILYTMARNLPGPTIWNSGENSKAARLLEKEGFGLSLAVPLQIGTFRTGTLLVLGMPEEGNILPVLGTLATLSTVVALVLRNAFLYQEQQKSTVSLQEAQRLAKLGSWSWHIDSDEIIWSDEMYRIMKLDRHTPALRYTELLGFFYFGDESHPSAGGSRGAEIGEALRGRTRDHLPRRQPRVWSRSR